MGQYQTVKQLRAFIAELPDDMPVLIPGGDHEYFIASVGVADVWRNDPKTKRPGQVLFEEFGLEGNTNARAFVVSRG